MTVFYPTILVLVMDRYQAAFILSFMLSVTNAGFRFVRLDRLAYPLPHSAPLVSSEMSVRGLDYRAWRAWSSCFLGETWF